MVHHHPSHRNLAVCLSGLAGFVDALGFMSLGGFFISFMSGNSTRFAVEAAEQGLTWVTMLPLAVIILFVIGVMAGVFVRHFVKARRSFAVLVLVAVLLGLAALAEMAGSRWGCVVLMVLAMGAVNNVFVRNGEVSIGVTYMTGALVKFGQRLAARFLGQPNDAWLLYLMLWMGLITGAILGASAFYIMDLNAVWIAAGFSAILLPVLWRMEG
jgi:uncharacterized membrane protein YoaK (UPF0700 family)